MVTRQLQRYPSRAALSVVAAQPPPARPSPAGTPSPNVAKRTDTPLRGGWVRSHVLRTIGLRPRTPPLNGVSLGRREYLDRYRALAGAANAMRPPAASLAWSRVTLHLVRLAAYYRAVFPSVRHLALRAGCSESTVHRVVRWLEAQGHLTVTRVDRTDGSQASNDYDPAALISAIMHLVAEAMRVVRGLTRLPDIWRAQHESYESAWTRAGWRPGPIMRGGGAA